MRAMLVGCAVLALLGSLGGCSSSSPPSSPPSSASAGSSSSVSAGVPAASTVAGTPNWRVTHPGPEHAIEGFADRVSVLPGQDVRLFVSTTAKRFTVTALRIGAYRGSDALQVWQSNAITGTKQAAAVVRRPTNTVVAPWRPSLTLHTSGWQPGDYLLRLDGDNSAQQFVPLTLRTPSNAGRIVIINAVTTWQAYNRWGGYSLYDSPSGKADRSRVVSFDRPYQAKDMTGAGDFLYFELPMVHFAEQAGVPLGYATDVDLDADPHLLDGARAMITLGHDEYWSTAMRQHTAAARDHGVNLGFLGGNEIYRHIRFESSALGQRRLEVDYKSFADDPFSKTNPREATPQWRQGPYPRPESVLLGNFYQCNPAQGDLVVADANNWLLTGIVHNGQKLPGLVGNEYEKVDLSVPTPRPIEVLFHSPVTCGGKADFSDASYYTTPSGAAVFSTGTQYWICALDPNCTHSHRDPTAYRAITTITTRLLRAFAAGPTGKIHPATDNLAAIGVKGAKPNPRPTLPSEDTH
ncbi:MAG: hypothetical protein J2O49_07525 [Sciscionella sp.]|nr:hypothetical protein [Sciscionella sp.]